MKRTSRYGFLVDVFLIRIDNIFPFQITASQQDGENELRIQLKRQLYVFQEYFKEQFILYKTELKRKLETDLKNKVLQEKAKIADDYEESFKKLKQMEALLQGKRLNMM